MNYHGNYCGPGWSAGEYQDSVVSDVHAIDEFDDTCKLHDAAYATNGDLLHADLLFAYRNIGKGYKRSAAAIAVGGQAAIRAIDKYIPKVYQDKEKMSFRGNKVQVAHLNKEPVKSNTAQNAFATQVNAPASMGTVLRGGGVVSTKKSKDNISMDVQVCVGRPAAALQSATPELVALQYLSPIALGNDEVQNMTRVYQHYRITSAKVHFRAIQGTNIGGEVIIVADSDPNYRPINTTGGTTFYQRALATKHALLSPIWLSESMDLPVDTAWKLCDNANSTTLEEFESGVVYIYSDAATLISGFFIISLKIEFSGLRFNSRNLIAGSFLGLGTRQSITVTAPTSGADATWTISGATTGDIYAVQLSATNASFSAGTATTLMVLQAGTGTIPYIIGGSSLVYARANSATSISLYSTYDSAIGSDISDKFLWGLTSVGTTTLPACIVTQLRNSTQPTL